MAYKFVIKETCCFRHHFDKLRIFSVPDCESAATQTDGRKFSHEDLINVCPHGTCLPVHEHRYRMKICLDGTKEVTSETLVHCAACPRPSIKIDFGQF